MNRFTKIIATYLLSCSLFSLSAHAQEADQSPFTDVQEGIKHFVSIDYLKGTNSISGYEDGSFKPFNEINRAEALVMAMRAFQPENRTENQLPESDSDLINFTDVPAEAWFHDSIIYAANHSIISGYDDNTFKPTQSITLGEGLAIVLRTLNKEIPTDITEAPFSDVPADSWYAPYFRYANEQEIINVYRGNKVYPNEPLDRGEMADLIYRTLQSSLGAKYGTASYYSDSLEGRGTASGEVFTQSKLTAAHLTLPFGTKLKVTNLYNGKSVEVVVNDRGPYGHPGRKLDLSRSAFEAIGRTSRGYIYVEYKIIDQ